MLQEGRTALVSAVEPTLAAESQLARESAPAFVTGPSQKSREIGNPEIKMSAAAINPEGVSSSPAAVSSNTAALSPNTAALSPSPSAAPALATDANGLLIFKNKNISVQYNVKTGTADFYKGNRKIISSFYSSVKLPQVITSKDYTSRSAISIGNEYIVTLSDPSKPTMVQHFSFNASDSFTVWVEMAGQNLSSNWMAPIVTDGKGSVDIGSYSDVRALWVPFDNDRNAKFDASTINQEDTSYEASAFYDNTSRIGLVIGSVTHDTWKTGISYKGSSNKLDELQVFGGVTINNSKHYGTMKRDVQEHGSVKGDTIVSPQIFVGFFDDWRNGMEAYGDANSAVAPKLIWNGGVPFGWNSWGAVGSGLSTENALAASNFIKNNLMNNNFINNNTVYINLDSYWDSPSIDLEQFVKTVHKNNQKAGIYWAPFVDWIKDPNRTVEGANYKYSDAWLKDKNGNPITYQNGPYAMDPTHPATKARIDYFMNLFKRYGFDEYIKIDFLSHGALEGQHYDPSVTTGMQAMNMGMDYLYKAITSKMGPNTFISEAISPIFPYQYTNARRISCDKFGFINESRDLLNTIAYGFWMNGRLYNYNDPDHMVLYNVWWKSSTKVSENEAKTRVTSAVVAGTLYLSGDDFTDPNARARAQKYLTNPNINKIARLGLSFRPVEGNTGMDAPDVFTLNDGRGNFYIAVFNWDNSKSVNKTVDLKRAGLDPNKKYSAVEQWSDASSQVIGKLTANLEPAEAKIYLLK